MTNVKFHTKKNATWTDATGLEVPLKFVPKSDIKKEEVTASVLKEAMKVSDSLAALYSKMVADLDAIHNEYLEEYRKKYGKNKVTKGAFTYYNFDRSVKIECAMNDIVKWDAALMSEAYELLQEYLSKNLTEDGKVISQLVLNAFANSKKQIDTGKVFTLLKFENKIKSEKFQRACSLMKDAQGVERTKQYMRVWCKNEAGEYQNINLNFSSI